jgi:quercetin dioxygenase-like cupin family protein
MTKNICVRANTPQIVPLSEKENIMADTSVKKVDSAYSPKGQLGQKYLASGKSLSMRLWEDEQPNEPKEPTVREYETVGYVIKGSAELHIEGQVVRLEVGNSWVVPKGASHTYKILEPFTAVEATSPPAQVHGRDEN